MVQAYAINSVPSFYLQGYRTSLAALKQAPILSLPSLVQGVALPWDRYQDVEMQGNTTTESAAILFPPETEKSDMLNALAQYKPRYVFSADNWDVLCSVLHLKACKESATARTQIAYYQELVALLGVKP